MRSTVWDTRGMTPVYMFAGGAGVEARRGDVRAGGRVGAGAGGGGAAPHVRQRARLQRAHRAGHRARRRRHAARHHVRAPQVCYVNTGWSVLCEYTQN